MPRPGFYNDNEYRAYPFVFKPAQVNKFSDAIIVDAGIIMGLDSEFSNSDHAVWLHEVRRVTRQNEEDVFEFEIRSDAPGTISSPLIFTRAADAEEWENEYVESAAYRKNVNSCAVEPAWSGFLVTGPLTALKSLLPPGGDPIKLHDDTESPADPLYELEPARIQNLTRHYLRSISIGNLSRPLAGSACDTDNDDNAREVIVNYRCISGDIRFQEGYNCQIRQATANNDIIVSASKGLGAPIDSELCENHGEIPFYPGEAPPPGSKFLSGGPACDELVSTINGVSGPDINIVAGTGVTVTPNPETNTIQIEISATNNAGNC